MNSSLRVYKTILLGYPVSADQSNFTDKLYTCCCWIVQPIRYAVVAMNPGSPAITESLLPARRRVSEIAILMYDWTFTVSVRKN